MPQQRPARLAFAGGTKAALASPYLWAVLARVAIVVFVPRSMQGDAIDYHLIANNLSSGRGFSRCWAEPFYLTSQRPPLYPIALALVYLVGVSQAWAAILLNGFCDLLSMWLARVLADDLRLKSARFAPWIVGFCPLLITYGAYPTTENLSILLFLVALVLTFRRMPVSAGISWGLVSLCRSYYLLLPLLFLAFRPSPWWTRRALALMAALSFVAPVAWMTRNHYAVGKFGFTQGGMVGWQTYQGLLFPAFDWWRPEQVDELFSVPEVVDMARAQCVPDDAIFELDQRVLALVKEGVAERPLETARNVLIKGVNLFVNWGLIMPYNRVPFLVTHLINGLLFAFWFVVGALALRWHRSGRRGPEGMRDLLKFSAVAIGYVFAVTLPFAVDARYLLGPFLTIFLVALDIARGPPDAGRSGEGRA